MYVFVYGTLTNAARAEAVLGGTPRGAGTTGPIDYEFVGEATLEGLNRIDGEYPTLVPGGSVDGRVLEVDERGLEALDAYEGLDQGLYVRAAVPWVDHSDIAPPGSSQRTTAGDGTAADDFEVAVAAGLNSSNELETDTENIVWTYIGDPERLGLDSEREDDTYWTGNGTFLDRVRQYVTANTVIAQTTE